MDYDLIIIGGGTAGMNAMKAAHSLGAKVAIAEEETFAGTCLTSGCKPPGTFTRGRRADRLGIKGADQLRLDWPAMISRKNEIVSNWSKSKNETPAKLGITALRGHAAFTGAHEIAVAGRNYSADKFVIAIGSKPARPPIWGRGGRRAR